MSFLEDLGTGITEATTAKLAKYTTDTHNETPVSGNTGAYLGKSIVDAVGTWITLGADKARTNLVERFSNSGTGSKMVSEARNQEFMRLLNDPMTWLIALGVIFGFLALGRMSR